MRCAVLAGGSGECRGLEGRLECAELFSQGDWGVQAAGPSSNPLRSFSLCGCRHMCRKIRKLPGMQASRSVSGFSGTPGS